MHEGREIYRLICASACGLVAAELLDVFSETAGGSGGPWMALPASPRVITCMIPVLASGWLGGGWGRRRGGLAATHEPDSGPDSY